MGCFSCLVLITGLLFLTLGCGEENEIQEPKEDFRVAKAEGAGDKHINRINRIMEN